MIVEEEGFEESFVVFGTKKDRLAIGIKKKEVRVYALPEFKRLHSFKSNYNDENGDSLIYTGIIAGTCLRFKEARAIWDKVIRCGKYVFQILFGQYLID